MSPIIPGIDPGQIPLRRGAPPPTAAPVSSRALPPLPKGMQSRITPLLEVLAGVYPAMVEHHRALAQEFFQKGALIESERRWRWVLSLRPTHLQGMIGLAWLWIDQGRLKEAAMLLRRALMLHPKQVEARWLLARATESRPGAEPLPLTTPPRMLERRYAMIAPYYDLTRLVDENYRAHAEVTQLMLQHLEPPPRMRVLDLGCGTGLVGEVLWPVRPHLEGVDMLGPMLKRARPRVRLLTYQKEKLAELERARENGMDVIIPRALARAKPVYDALWNEDARDFLLRPRAQGFDAILAADVFCEIGGLSPVFDGAARNLLPGGIFAFSTDAGPAEGYAPQGAGVRFAHSQPYLDELAARVGLRLIRHLSGPLDRHRSARYSLYRKA